MREGENNTVGILKAGEREREKYRTAGSITQKRLKHRTPRTFLMDAYSNFHEG